MSGGADWLRAASNDHAKGAGDRFEPLVEVPVELAVEGQPEYLAVRHWWQRPQHEDETVRLRHTLAPLSKVVVTSVPLHI